jgi:hypothetical protein
MVDDEFVDGDFDDAWIGGIMSFHNFSVLGAQGIIATHFEWALEESRGFRHASILETIDGNHAERTKWTRNSSKEISRSVPVPHAKLGGVMDTESAQSTQ